MTPSEAVGTATLADQLSHVRWIVGGTGSGKSIAARRLARRFHIEVYSGDRAEHDWLQRSSPQRHPHFATARHQRPGDSWRGRSAQQVFEAMAGYHGETVEFLVDDLLGLPPGRPLLVDYFGVLPRDLAPLLHNPTQCAFLVPTPEFRRTVLGRRYADDDRARANWGNLDPAGVLRKRLQRDALWDAEVTAQAIALDLPLIIVDGRRPPEAIVDELAERFRLR